MNFKKRDIIAFIYACVLIYFVIYQFVIRSLYTVNTGSDWGLLVIILGWPIYLFFLLPLFAYKGFYKNILIDLPIGLGIITLLVITISGRLVFQPFYNMGIDELNNKLKIHYARYSYLGIQPVEGTPYTEPTAKGILEIDNQVSFPIKLTIKPRFSPRDSFLQGTCQIDGELTYLIKKGKNSLEYVCGFAENYVDKVKVDNITYTFQIQDKDNAAIITKKVKSSNELADLSTK